LNPDDLRQLTDDMVTQVDELASLVTDLGELSRGERSEGTIETLRLDDCLDECVDTARTYARIKEITIDVNVERSNVLDGAIVSNARSRISSPTRSSSRRTAVASWSSRATARFR